MCISVTLGFFFGFLQRKHEALRKHTKSELRRHGPRLKFNVSKCQWGKQQDMER